MSPIERAWLSLEGLSVGDTFGERYFGEPTDAVRRIFGRILSTAPWPYTDDTEMALSVFEVLRERREVHQDALADLFARRMTPGRGYGQGSYAILVGIQEGRNWRALTQAGFRGMGSFGNGAAMRVAPLGAYFAESPIETICEQARLSAEITHSHPEGVAGAIAVAVAAALAWQARNQEGALGKSWMEEVRDVVPAGYTREAIEEAVALPEESTVIDAAVALGNGSGVTAPDTVPLCLWVAAYKSFDFEEALWQTVSALGDRDTTCAIVGGIVALKTGRAGIPDRWLAAREELPLSGPT